MKKLIFLLIFILCVGSVSAVIDKNNMKLLAVSETSDGNFTGSVADLTLEIIPGQGRVFIDTYPLTKLDTQISTRFAKEVACDYIEVDCQKYDFIYTIKARSSIIGGPSAGAALTILTITMLDGQPIDKNVAITGTINSGGLIGFVGGVKEKTEAADKFGLNKVLIPFGETEFTKDNVTYDLRNKTSIDVVPILDLSEALYEFTGKDYEVDYGEVVVPEHYVKSMTQVALSLGKRNEELYYALYNTRVNLSVDDFDETFLIEEEKAINLTKKAEDAFNNGSYYAAASFYFGSNIRLRHLSFLITDFDDDSFEIMADTLERDVAVVELRVNSRNISTINDLQTYALVKDRLTDAKDNIAKAREKYVANDTDYKNDLAYSVERIASARVWQVFFGQPGKKLDFDEESLEKSCVEKIAESEERIQYLNYIFPQRDFPHIENQIDHARRDKVVGQYALCLFRAGFAKADSDMIINSIGFSDDFFDDYFEKRIDKVERDIARQTKKGIFPYISYSYFDYSKVLFSEDESDKYSALLFSEYALEMSNLDIYFDEKSVNDDNYFEIPRSDVHPLLAYFLGFILGGCFVYLLMRFKQNKRRINRINKASRN